MTSESRNEVNAPARFQQSQVQRPVSVMSGSVQNACSQEMAMSDFNQQSYQASRQGQGVPGVTVVNQMPLANPAFPLRFQRCSVLAIAILKVIVGAIQFCLGIANILLVPYNAFFLAFPLWCGILFIVNGIIGLCSYKWPSKCMIGSLLGLSIASLILTFTMMGFFSEILRYFSEDQYYTYCDYFSNQFACEYRRRFSGDKGRLAIGLTSFLMFLIVSELALSICAVVYSCQAYSRCCNTCNVSYCCSCVGCCECDTRIIPKTFAPQAQPYPFNMQTQQQPSALQDLQNASACSALFNIIVSFPGASRAFKVATIPNTARGEPNTVEVTFQGENTGRP